MSAIERYAYMQGPFYKNFSMPARDLTEAEASALQNALLRAFPKWKVETNSVVGYPSAWDIFAHDPQAVGHICGISYPVGPCLKWPREKALDRVAGVFLRAIRELGHAYEAGVIVANHGLDVDRLANVLIRLGSKS